MSFPRLHSNYLSEPDTSYTGDPSNDKCHGGGILPLAPVGSIGDLPSSGLALPGGPSNGINFPGGPSSAGRFVAAAGVKKFGGTAISASAVAAAANTAGGGV